MGTNDNHESIGTKEDANTNKLTREQRRAIDRINKEAEATYKRLCEQYYTIFMDNDPDGTVVLAKEIEVLTKWKMYAVSRQFSDDAKGILKQYIDQVRKQYNDAKAQG